jgi:uncharacterized protein (TIGR02594 family)
MTGYEWLKSHLGLHEVKDRKAIIALLRQYAEDGDILIDPSDTPWCAAIVNAAERAAENPGTGRLNARSFATYGKPVPSLKDARKGDIVVFTRGGSSWQGHVAYFDGLEGDIIRTLGGNQSNSISYGWYKKDRLLAIRRPD